MSRGSKIAIGLVLIGPLLVALLIVHDVTVDTVLYWKFRQACSDRAMFEDVDPTLLSLVRHKVDGSDHLPLNGLIMTQGPWAFSGIERGIARSESVVTYLGRPILKIHNVAWLPKSLFSHLGYEKYSLETPCFVRSRDWRRDLIMNHGFVTANPISED